MPKPAKPDRYQVDRVGTPDPATSQYYVLDVVNDWTAREALAYLGNRYRQRGLEVRARECFDLLHETLEEHKAYWEARQVAEKKTKRRKKEIVTP